MSSYKDLLIWQKGIDLSLSIYEMSKSFPIDEQFGLTSQLRRSATSVPLNIAEGYGRGSNKSFANFIKIARGSLFELSTIMEISFRLEYVNIDQNIFFSTQIEELGKMLNGFLKTLEK
jgi:four helix bundle protein